MTDVAASSSDAEPRTSFNSSLDGLESINEHDVRQEGSVTSHDVGDELSDSRHNATEDSDENKFRLPGGANTGSVSFSRQSVPPKTTHKGKNVDGNYVSQGTKRQSTMGTQNSAASAPFSETEIWDQKTVLSLGELVFLFGPTHQITPLTTD